MPACSLFRATKILSLAITTGVCLSVGLAGCVAGRTFVLEPPTAVAVHSGLTLRPVRATIAIDAERLSEFDGLLATKLFEQVAVASGATDLASPGTATLTAAGGLTIEYRFTLFDEGEGVVRFGSTLTNFVGSPFYGLGDGAVGVEVRFLNDRGSLIGHIVTNGTISGAFGSVSAALDEAADSIAKYTQANFFSPASAAVEEIAER